MKYPKRKIPQPLQVACSIASGMKNFSISLVGNPFVGARDCCLFSQESLLLSEPLSPKGKLQLGPIHSQAEQSQYHLPHVLLIFFTG